MESAMKIKANDLHADLINFAKVVSRLGGE